MAKSKKKSIGGCKIATCSYKNVSTGPGQADRQCKLCVIEGSNMCFLHTRKVLMPVICQAQNVKGRKKNTGTGHWVEKLRQCQRRAVHGTQFCSYHSKPKITQDVPISNSAAIDTDPALLARFEALKE